MILDTNAVSALLAGEPAIAEVLDEVPRHALPVIVLGEYRFGLLRSRFRAALEPLVDELSRVCDVLDVDAKTARAYADVRDELRAAGTPIPENDVWIAALARQHGLPVLSRDAHFDKVAGVERRSW